MLLASNPEWTVNSHSHFRQIKSKKEFLVALATFLHLTRSPWHSILLSKMKEEKRNWILLLKPLSKSILLRICLQKTGHSERTTVCCTHCGGSQIDQVGVASSTPPKGLEIC